MRKYNVVLFLFILTFLSLSCTEEKTAIAFKEVNITTIKNDIVEINIPKAVGDDEISKKINTKLNELLAASLQVATLDSIPARTLEESIDRFNKTYNNFKTEFPESPMVWEAQIDGEITYQSDAIISLAITNYQNTGGAHGNLVVSFLNFDVLTGNIIPNEKLFSDFSSFKKLAEDYFHEEITGKEEDFFEPNNFTLPENIGYDDEGLILFYNTYEIAPYSSGITEIHIPYTKVENFLRYK